jgi:hypothetical protein
MFMVQDTEPNLIVKPATIPSLNKLAPRLLSILFLALIGKQLCGLMKRQVDDMTRHH